MVRSLKPATGAALAFSCKQVLYGLGLPAIAFPEFQAQKNRKSIRGAVLPACWRFQAPSGKVTTFGLGVKLQYQGITKRGSRDSPLRGLPLHLALAVLKIRAYE